MAKVLLVEDDPLLVNIFTTYLQNKGHTVHAVSDGSVAFQTALEFRPHLILLDLMIPKLGGTRILEELRAQKNFKRVPILVYTNLAADENKTEVLAKGANEFLSKAETKSKDLLQKIENYL